MLIIYKPILKKKPYLLDVFLELLRDGENKLVKSQAKDFFKKYPSSTYSDNLHLMLGNVYTKEMEFQNALDEYNNIVSTDFRSKGFNQ